MDREIKFRGKLIGCDEWIYGFYMVGLNNLSYIINKREVDKNTHILDYTIVIEESLGQFTGLQDQNGVDIYEGDILGFGEKSKDIVVYENGGFQIFEEPIGWTFDQESGFSKYDFKYCEIIGNIHENPELKP